MVSGLYWQNNFKKSMFAKKVEHAFTQIQSYLLITLDIFTSKYIPPTDYPF